MASNGDRVSGGSLDRVRRKVREQPLDGAGEQAIAAHRPSEARDAAGTLLGRLSPHERAAVVLKDVFDLSLDEIATALATTVGTVKSALHRARGKLADAPAVLLASDAIAFDTRGILPGFRPVRQDYVWGVGYLIELRHDEAGGTQ